MLKQNVILYFLTLIVLTVLHGPQWLLPTFFIGQTILILALSIPMYILMKAVYYSVVTPKP